MTTSKPHCRRTTRSGFTLVEALLAITMTALAASVLLLAVTSSMNTATEAIERSVAAGMAQQLMNEVVGCRFVELVRDASDTPLPPSSITPGQDIAEPRRINFDDVDDYDGYRSLPPRDAYGVLLGFENGFGGPRAPTFQAPVDMMKDWRQEIDVYYVAESNPSVRLLPGQTSDYRVVEVRIVKDPPDGGARELAKLRRVVSYVPPM